MHHATPLITTIVGGLVLAFILGMIANKLRISPLVGYLLAGWRDAFRLLFLVVIVHFWPGKPKLQVIVYDNFIDDVYE